MKCLAQECLSVYACVYLLCVKDVGRVNKGSSSLASGGRGEFWKSLRIMPTW